EITTKYGGTARKLIVRLAVSGQRVKDRRRTAHLVAEKPGELVTVQHRQADVEHRDIRDELVDQRESARAVVGGLDGMVPLPQHSGQRFGRVPVVVDDDQPSPPGR